MTHYQHITVTPLSPHIGAEIANIDLTRPLTDEQLVELKRSFLKCQLIFFRE
jgi:taurine dioxygenase